MSGLRLIGRDDEDLAVISTLVQDAVVRLGDFDWDPAARRFTLLLSRLCCESETPSRVHAALRFQSVSEVKRRGWPDDRSGLVELMAMLPEDESVLRLEFSGGAGLRLTLECVEVLLEDIGEPWPIEFLPHRPED